MTLFYECLRVLGEDASVLSSEETEHIIKNFKDRIPMTPWGKIDWDKVSKKETIEDDASKILPYLCKSFEVFNATVYLLWDEYTLPSVKTELKRVIEFIDDVTAVSFDVWVVSTSYEYVIEFYHEGKITIGVF